MTDKKKGVGIVSARLPSQWKERLETVADKLSLSESELGAAAIKALIECVEANDYRILWPPRFYLDQDTRVEKV